VSHSAHLAILYADACGFTSAMTKSEEDAIARLKSGQRLLRQAARHFGGHVIDMVGDSALITFDTVTAAFGAARQFKLYAVDIPAKTGVAKPFAYRFGLAEGAIRIDGKRIFGNLVNQTARIASLVGRNCIGVEGESWARIQPAIGNAQYIRRVLFAKAEEQAIQFFEIASEGGSLSGTPNERNQPIILVAPLANPNAGIEHDIAMEQALWECSSMYTAHGWRHDIDHRYSPGAMKTLEPDYVQRLRVTKAFGDLRIAMTLSSPHSPRGVQNFVRTANASSQVAEATIAIAADAVSAISYIEIERAAGSRNIGTYQLVAAGRALTTDFSESAIQQAMVYLQKAMAIDPDYPLLQSTLARAYAINWRFGWAADGTDKLAMARDLAQKARTNAPEDARIEADLGFVKVWNNETEDSVWHYERALNALPFHPELAADAGMVLCYAGRNDEAAQILERSISNLSNDADYRLWSLGDVYFGKREYKSALKWLNRMANPAQAQRLIAASKARLGLDASAHVAAVLQEQPDFSVRHWVGIQPFNNEADREDYLSALLQAGLPE
jgi:Tfp pilus assembly protein PilF